MNYTRMKLDLTCVHLVVVIEAGLTVKALAT